MNWVAPVLVVLAGLLAFNAVVFWLRRRRRAGAVRMPQGAQVLREATELPVRVFVDQSVAGGPQARGINRGKAHIVLTADRFILATWQGRVLDIHAAAPGDGRCVGPRRLVVEGAHPGGRARVRAELLVDDAEGWAEAIGALGEGA